MGSQGAPVSPRPSRKADMTAAALTALKQYGYVGTSMDRLATMTGLSKAAFTYHFESKETLLLEVASPLTNELQALEKRHPSVPEWPGEIRELLDDYLTVLTEHGEIVAWIDADKAVLNHPLIGALLLRSNRFMRRALTAGDRTDRARVQASAILGMLWRPLRNLGKDHVRGAREQLLTMAVDAVGAIRRGTSHKD